MTKTFSKYFDHTILKTDATKAEVSKICDEALEYDFASVCVNGYFVSYVSERLMGSAVRTCAVVGFPLGAMDSQSKAYEAETAVKNGADEIDMVINIGALKDRDYDTVETDIRMVKKACGSALLKVIIETCLLNDEEKMKVCQLAVRAGAEYVKTSTGCSKAGANASDVRLMKETAAGKTLVKASGGIRDYNTAAAMIEAGADRLGTSATVLIMGEFYKKKKDAEAERQRPEY